MFLWISTIKPWRISRLQDIIPTQSLWSKTFSIFPPGDKRIPVTWHRIFFPFNLRQLKMEHCYWAGTALPLGILCIMSWNLSRSNIRKHPEIKLGKENMSSPRQKRIAPYPCFSKSIPCTAKLLENLFLPKPQLLPVSSQVPIQGQWLNTSTGKTVQAEIYTQQDGRMLSSLQGGRKENPLVVRKEARFNKALLSLEKGKQAEKHVLPTTQLCLHRLLAWKIFNFYKN